MDGVSVLRARLADRDEAALTALLEQRADVLAGVAPHDLTELAHRLWHPHSLIQALHRLPRPLIETLEAAQALGDGCTRAALAELLDGTGPGHRDAVDRVVDELAGWAIVGTDGDRLLLPEALDDVFPEPLGLGPPLHILLRDQPLAELRRVPGVARQRNRADSVEALRARLGDPGTVRSIVEQAPAAIGEHLLRTARGHPLRDNFYDPRTYRSYLTAVEWGIEHGLLVGSPWAHDGRMPAEVARALRGPDFRAPFHPEPPRVSARPVGAAVLREHCAAAAAGFAEQLLAILDRVSRAPVPALKSGGVGTRELGRLAKSTATDETVTRLALELAAAAGLLTHDGLDVSLSDDFAVWRDADPADRYAAVLDAWWRMGATPSQSRDEDGKTLRALTRGAYCDGCRSARVSMLESLAELDGAADRGALAARALWRRPLVHLVVQDADAPLATPWREAELLGVIVDGALTELGRTLVAGSELTAALQDLLPRSAEHATFGSDLTAYVVGAPSGRLSSLLDSSADRESRGGATTWRFSPASVRRAFDDGATADSLTAALAALASAPLPQPLTYLIGDVARRHGRLRLVAATTCICSDDTTLLAEVAADRKLAKLQLRLIAPTVLAARAPLPALLEALRAAGYFPVAGDEPDPSATAHLTIGVRRNAFRQAAPPPREPARDPRDVAAALLRRPGGKDAPLRLSPTERELADLAPQLSLPEIRQLAHAVDNRTAVRIEYLATTGGRTDRVIRRPELVAGSLFAWCELRSDERVFAVRSVQRVIAVDRDN